MAGFIYPHLEGKPPIFIEKQSSNYAHCTVFDGIFLFPVHVQFCVHFVVLVLVVVVVVVVSGNRHIHTCSFCAHQEFFISVRVQVSLYAGFVYFLTEDYIHKKTAFR